MRVLGFIITKGGCFSHPKMFIRPSHTTHSFIKTGDNPSGEPPQIFMTCPTYVIQAGSRSSIFHFLFARSFSEGGCLSARFRAFTARADCRIKTNCQNYFLSLHFLAKIRLWQKVFFLKKYHYL